MQWVIGMTTAPRPGPLMYTKTLAFCHSAGWDQTVHICAEPESIRDTECPHPHVWHQNSKQLKSWRNFLNVMCVLAQQPRADVYLYLQDDVQLACGLRDYVESQLWPADMDEVGALSLYTSSPNHPTGWDGDRWRDLSATPTRCYGALALVLPPDVVQQLAGELPTAKKASGSDIRFSKWLAERKRRYFAHIPSLAQHLGYYSSIHRMGMSPSRCAAPFCDDASSLGVVS